MGMVGEACLPSNTIRGRLITPFILGPMSVGLNILIRHSFTDLYEFGLWLWYPDRNYFVPKHTMYLFSSGIAELFSLSTNGLKYDEFSGSSNNFPSIWSGTFV